MNDIWLGGSFIWGIRPEFKDQPTGGATQCLLAGNHGAAPGPKGGDGQEQAQKPAQHH